MSYFGNEEQALVAYFQYNCNFNDFTGENTEPEQDQGNRGQKQSVKNN